MFSKFSQCPAHPHQLNRIIAIMGWAQFAAIETDFQSKLHYVLKIRVRQKCDNFRFCSFRFFVENLI